MIVPYLKIIKKMLNSFKLTFINFLSFDFCENIKKNVFM